LLWAAVTAAACATTINHVLADPSRYRNKEVKISGRVEDSFSIVDRGAYRIVDKTGEMWVVSDRGVPRVGASVVVHGTIREGFNLGVFGGRIKLPGGVSSGLVLVESSHRAKY
jgi:hypothetical protein